MEKSAFSEENMIQSDTLKAVLSQSGTKEPVLLASAMSQHGNGPSRKSFWNRRLASFGSWNNPKWGFAFLLLVLAANIVLAMLAWVIVKLVTG